MLYVYVTGLAPRRWQHGDDSVTRPPHRAEKTNAGRMTDAVQWDLASRAAPTRPYCGSWTREGGAGDAESISATARNVLGRNIGSAVAAPTPTTGSINRSIPIRSEVSITWSSSSSSAVARRQRPTVRTASSSTHDSISFTARRARKSVVYLCDSGTAVWNSLPSDLCMTTLTLIHSKTSQSALLVLLIGDSCTALANVEQSRVSY